MLDPKFVRENLELVATNCRRRGVDPEAIGLGEFAAVASRRSELLTSTEAKRAERNQLAAQAATDTSVRERARALKEDLVEEERELKEVEARYQEILSWIPNMIAADSPLGSDESGNVEVAAWSPEAGFLTEEQLQAGAAQHMPAAAGVKDHLELGKSLDLIDTEQSAKVSGARFCYLKNGAVLLQNALHQLLAKKLLDEGFTPMVPPVLVREAALFGTSHFPGDRDQVYQIATENVEDATPLYLVGSAEPSLFAYYLDRVVTEEELPAKMFALTTCFRSEAGSWGKDVRGIKRVHQFDKLEMDVVCLPEQATEIFEQLRGVNEWLLQTLRLPYRVINMCSGDLGYYASHRKYDIEVWLPSQQAWMELMSDTHATDYQARRLNLRLRRQDGSLTYPHTVNDTGVAMGRMIIAILEHWQQPDGSVKVPDALQPYTFGLTEFRA